MAPAKLIGKKRHLKDITPTYIPTVGATDPRLEQQKELLHKAIDNEEHLARLMREQGQRVKKRSMERLVDSQIRQIMAVEALSHQPN